ncbi:MAG TPA: dephospho-CoA kinase [Candidatus Ligilactobacillus excrementipullorum]|nr:dephospho-CoA kinase [Candidatus Ligilactobacillus excrementipullorum]
MTYVLGLTGGIASGKSTVSNYLYEQGAVIVDADVVAREVVEPGTAGLKQLEEQFGPEIIAENGSLDRGALGQIIFNDQAKRELVNDILHPLIKEEMLAQVRAAEQKDVTLVILDIPLLFESHCERFCDSVLVVEIDPQIQLERLMSRNNLTQAEAQARVDSQMDPATRHQLADFVVNNDHEPAETYKQVDQILEDILK